MSKWISAVLCLLVLAILLPTAAVFRAEASVPNAPPTVSAQSAILIEAQSGETVFAKSAYLPLPMASTTKIMTAIVALELAEPNTVIRVDSEAVGVEGSSIYLQESEELTLEQLLYALLLESANDAAVAIAIGLSQSVEAFAAEMNRTAERLGLEQTHFTNPHGLDDEEHYTTAYDLARIAQALLQNELLREIVSTRKYTLTPQNGGNSRLLINHNKLLRMYDGCIGMKTGFTKRSGRCLVSAAERDGVTLIAVTLNAPNDWDDHTAMLDYGFRQYESVTLCQEEEYLFPLSLVGGKDTYVMITNTDSLSVTLPIGHGEITKTVEAPRFEYAPIQSGQVMGRVIWKCDTNGDGSTEMIGEVPLSACYTVERLPVKRSFWQWLLDLLGIT